MEGFKENFEEPNHNPARIMLSLEKRFFGDSSLTTKYKGQSEKFDDLKTGTPSVFQVKDKL